MSGVKSLTRRLERLGRMLLALLAPAVLAERALCESWCADVPCAELNGDAASECGACGPASACWPGAIPSKDDAGAPLVDAARAMRSHAVSAVAKEEEDTLGRRSGRVDVLGGQRSSRPTELV